MNMYLRAIIIMSFPMLAMVVTVWQLVDSAIWPVYALALAIIMYVSAFLVARHFNG